MNVFDLEKITAHPLKEKEKNIFHHGRGFKARIIELPPGGAVPPCDMAQNVVFTVVSGSVEITVNNETAQAQPGHCVVTQPATVAMKSTDGARVMAIQIDDFAQPAGSGGE